MGLMSGLVVFTISWWLCFFVALPIGVQGQWEDDSTVPGTEEAAPKNPMLKKKAMWATAGAVVITGIAAIVVPRLLAQ
mgnify:CR=1 FL=1